VTNEKFEVLVFMISKHKTIVFLDEKGFFYMDRCLQGLQNTVFENLKVINERKNLFSQT